MKRWGSYITIYLGYFVIGWIMGKWYHLYMWDAITLMFWVVFIQWLVKIINEIVEY